MFITTTIAIVLYIIGGVGLGYGCYAAAKKRYRSKAECIIITALCSIGWPIAVTFAVAMGVADYIKTKKG